MWDGLKPGPQYEQLSQAIIHAILSSNEVQSQVADLQSKGGLDDEDIIAMALRFPQQGGLEAKVEVMRRSAEEDGQLDIDEEMAADLEEDPSSPEPGPKGGCWVSSKRTLSPNEVAFEEYLQNRFNDESWMREVRVRFLQEKKEEGVPIREGESPEGDSE
jgi:hypothetical protein